MGGIAEMLLSGTTAFLDMYFYMDETARAVEQTGIRACLCRGMTADDGLAQKLAEVKDFYRRWQGAADGRIAVRVAPHAEYTNTDEAMAAYAAAARELGCGIHVHVSETRAEVEGCYARHGCSPVAYMERMGILDLPCVAAHCVVVDEADIAILARHGVSVAHNPSSNMKLGSGVAPVTAMLRAGVNVALGTDGTASNNNLDMIEEMHVGALIAKGFTQDPTAFNARQVLRAATMGGARALGMDAELGSLEAGKQADIVLLRADTPALCPMYDPADAVVYSSGRADIRMTMVGGRVLMENGT
jgi:5-methylthioadenosine/S-adenosylhomocysteine deaminase